ncbi:nicotinate phosphoribosyltransferase [Mariniphaga sediminis]|uniref:Nicotinate phosphoribosyltransferase n=1 Tax=Mariniphaga sediminis TaxID=1628158 RepID=A0A399D6U4_9BACT|nr:nicotinate phosphoribosyltransferase [Mariniphaga sediminis]RIH66110.1 nicotinate phosphoribosyltransferase [Mariniphaga sediminis]
MPLSLNHWGLYTDFYELTMAQGYFYCEKKEDTTTFNYFFRTNPFKGGFTVFAGLQDFLEILSEYTFSESDIQFLKSQGFRKEFLKYLSEFRFSGNVLSAREGEIMFPNEPVLQVEGNVIECQLIESFLLNILNFESLIATKAYRVKMVAENKPFTDFGLRRAQGLGALHASRAAVIGGASSTSNVLAGKLFNIPVSGTQAHSWIQSFEGEIEAFRAFAKIHPENTVLLVDTFDTIHSGIPNAILVAKEMEKRGLRLKAVRLDSGDLAYFSKKARKMLDEAGLEYVKIIASNQLNEHVIRSLLKDQNAPIDAFGIGTEMITGKNDAALDGVYKMTEINGKPKMKLSENIEKVTLPGKKQVYRCLDSSGMFYRDAILLTDEKPEEVKTICHPIYPERRTSINHLQMEPLLFTVVKKGQVVVEQKSPDKIHDYLQERAALLPDEHKRFISPHIYKVGISEKLMEVRQALTQSIKEANQAR